MDESHPGHLTEQFTDSRFAVRFQYLLTTPDGSVVTRVDEENERMLTVRVHTADRNAVYFEVSRFTDTTVDELYTGLRMRNVHPSAEMQIGELHTTRLAQQPSSTFSLRRGALVREVHLVQRGTDVYRITYEPTSPTNQQVLATLTFP